MYSFPICVTKKKKVQFPNFTQEAPVSRLRRKQRKQKYLKMGKAKRYWLLKTEPSEWSWSDQDANGGISKWDGVKNKQAQKNLKSMASGDLCFFYHSGTKSRCVVGVVEVVREWYADDDDGEGVVDVKAVGEMRRFVDLKEMKGDKGIKDFVLFRQPRLSVVPVEDDVWKKICELGDGFCGDGKEDRESSDES